MTDFLQRLVDAGSPEVGPSAEARLIAAIQLAKDAITKENLNPRLVKEALAIYLTHSDEALHLGVIVPSLSEHAEFKSDKEVPLSNPVTADTMKGVEILAYFREDYDLNEHHFHWHSTYPFSGVAQLDGKRRRKIDRQGELFLYMHSQMIARYNAELLSWGLDMTHAWGYDDVLSFGYTPVPNLRSTYGARPPFQGWFENHNPDLPKSQVGGFPSKEKMIGWRNNIFRSIEEGYFVTKKSNNEAGKLTLTPDNAMNWVGVVVEAEDLDLEEVAPGTGEYIFRELYGSLHNYGHDKFAEIGYSSDPKNPLGIMVTNNGSPRDPCFWLWHRHIDDFHQEIVKKYQQNLKEFKALAKIMELKIMTRDPDSDTPANGITTFLGPPRLHYNEVNAKIDHEPYQWELTIESLRNPPPDKSDPQEFTVRLFIAPKVLIQDQRAWIEMDKFTYELTKLQDTITRLDTESSVARIKRKPGEKLDPKCKCGWPPHMMLPIGTPEGMAYVVFAMLTDDKLAEVSTSDEKHSHAQCHNNMLSLHRLVRIHSVSVALMITSIQILVAWDIPLTRHGTAGLTQLLP